MTKKKTRKEPSELDRQVDRLLGEPVRVKMRGPRSGHSRSLAGRCIAVDGKQVLDPWPKAHVVTIEITHVEDPPAPAPMFEADLQRLRETRGAIQCPLPPGVTRRKR